MTQDSNISVLKTVLGVLTDFTDAQSGEKQVTVSRIQAVL